MITPLTEVQILELQKSLKRCTPETLEAVLHFRNEKDLEALPIIVFGVLQRFLPPSSSSRKVVEEKDETKLMEDLGLDSLTLLEVVMTLEECLGIHIPNEELRNIRTLGILKQFLSDKVRGVTPQAQITALSREEIGLTLPQQPPFLFLDSAQLDGEASKAQYTVRGDEFFLEGHFKNNHIVPASIVFEALGQLACLWILKKVPAQLEIKLSSDEVYFVGMDGVHFYKSAKPTDKLEFEQRLVKLRLPLAIFEGMVKVNGEKIAIIEKMTLIFGENPQNSESPELEVFTSSNSRRESA